MKDGRLNVGDYTLPVSVERLPASYSILFPDVSWKYSNFLMSISLDIMDINGKVKNTHMPLKSDFVH